MKTWLRKWLVGEISVRRMIVSLIEIYVCVLVLAWFFADRLIFQPQESSYCEGGDFYRIPVSASEKIGVLALPNPAATWTILHCHGNAEDIGDLHEFFEQYRSQGFQVYAFDYRGYGISDGKPGTIKACEDGEAALNHLVNDKKIPLNRIILHGRSVGAGVAAHLAAKHKVGGLIMESPFVTAFRVRTVISIAPFDRFRNDRRIREIACPLLLIHGLNDEVIPVWHGRKLFESARVPKLAYWVPGANHNDIPMIAGIKYWEHIQDLARLATK
ncbi:MAG: alpha/beta hydrolase [bacterium]